MPSIVTSSWVGPTPGDGGRDELHLVGDDGDAPDVHPELAKLPAQVGGIGIGDLAGENLVADEHDAGALGHGRWAIVARRSPPRAATVLR
jgi:hypothetical protein